MVRYSICTCYPRLTSFSTSKERDAETGLDYFLARYYSGAQGRFLSPDEFKGGIVDPFTGQQVSQPGPLPYADIWDPQTINKYGYVRNNSLRYVDPDGHNPLESLLNKIKGAPPQPPPPPPPPSAPVFKYSQSTGGLTATNGVKTVLTVGTGYAGHGKGLNRAGFGKLDRGISGNLA